MTEIFFNSGKLDAVKCLSRLMGYCHALPVLSRIIGDFRKFTVPLYNVQPTQIPIENCHDVKSFFPEVRNTKCSYDVGQRDFNHLTYVSDIMVENLARSGKIQNHNNRGSESPGNQNMKSPNQSKNQAVNLTWKYETPFRMIFPAKKECLKWPRNPQILERALFVPDSAPEVRHAGKLESHNRRGQQ